jgi:hypothetical protein
MGHLIWAIATIVFMVPFWKIFQKAGFPAPLSLVMLIPIVNFIALYFIAFANWPAQGARQ